MNYIFGAEVNELAIAVEEGARASKGNISKFMEPAEGTLRRALSKRHHIIFGRRGSGKSSLLYKSADELSKKGNPVALVDLEPFKGHQYPDIIISVLIATFKKYSIWVENQMQNDKAKRLWYTLFIKKKYSDIRKEKVELLTKINKGIAGLVEHLYLSDNAKLTQKINESNKEKNGNRIKSKASLFDNTIEGEIALATESSNSVEVKEEFKRSKQDYLVRKILDYQEIFTLLYKITQKDSYIFLDDLYHLVRTDQPDLIDYFHRISKGNNLWIKIATIRNRTSWYENTPQPIGMKIGDDTEEINLDLTLEKFSLSKSFLKSILEVYIKEHKSPKIEELLTDGGLDRLVLASGGVTRDFLGLFRRSIEEAKERVNRSGPDLQRGQKIGAEDVNIAAGSYGELKREEFQRDTLEDKDKLETSFENVKRFCLDKIKSNIFLIAQDAGGSEIELIKELIDLRLVHQVKSRVTISSRPGKIYKAYLLDVSQYTGERARKDIEMIEFWKDSEREKMRRTLLIYNPDIENEILLEDLLKNKTIKQNLSVNSKIKIDNQIDFDFGRNEN
jgi:hypothetical protein